MEINDFIEKRLKALIPNILSVIEIAFLYSKNNNGTRFKIVRKKVLDAINDAKRDILKFLEEKGYERKKV